MSPDSMPSDSLFDGERLSEPVLAHALGSVRALAAGGFTVHGPLGRDPEGTFTFLAHDLSADRLVVLKAASRSDDADAPTVLKVIHQLDASVPPPAGICAVCQTPIVGWDTACRQCGADLAGSDAPANQMLSSDELLSVIREAAEGYEVLGQMPRAAGGTPVYFARELQGGSIVALRLDAASPAGGRSGFTIAATRMMRPKLLHGSVGGAPRESGGGSTDAPPWALTPSPAPSLSPIGTRRPKPSTPAIGGGGRERTCPQCHETFGPELRFCPKDGSALRASEPSDDLVGQIIAERYHILSKLGEGGMGRVYLAEHVRMGRRCAIKVMHTMLLYDPDAVNRFNREAANASGISHPNVAAIYDFGESDGLLYLAMELVQGESLSALLARGPAFTESRAIDIALQVVDALGAAHELGIVHRDLKPDNIMITQSRDGRDVVKVVDFGIAKATKGKNRQTLTRTGFIVGTPAYMSPEQILGDAVDGRSDLYSLGCILYEMLTSERAFLDANGEVSLRQRLTEPPPQPSRVKHGLSSDLNSLVTTAMARDPEQRFQHAAEVRDALIEARNAPSAVSWRNRLPWRRSPKPSATAAPSRRAATSPERHSETAPTPPGGREASHAAPQRSIQRSSVARPRSALTPTWNPAWLVPGLVLTALLAFGVWRLLPPTSRSSTETASADSQIILPATETPPREAAPDTTPPPVAATPARDSASTGTFRFAGRLPAGATVEVDGARVTLSQDGSLSLTPGPHLLRVEAAGYQPMERSITIAAGKTEVTRAGLLAIKRAVEPSPIVPATKPVEVPTDGTILITGELPPGAEISLDGVTQPAGTREISAAVGSHWLSLSAPRFRPDSSQVEVKGGEKSSWEVPELTAIPRVVTVVMATPDTTIPVGSTLQMRARARDDGGTELSDSLVWESSSAEIVAVDNRGRATGRSAGRAYLRASTQGQADSSLVVVVAPAKPKPAAVVPRAIPTPAVRPPAEDKPAVPSVPSATNIQAAVNACAAALSSGDERRIVDAYKPKTAQDVTNLRKILEVAIRGGADLKATGTAVSAPSSTAPVGVDARVRFSWRNNAGVGKKKDAAFRV